MKRTLVLIVFAAVLVGPLLLNRWTPGTGSPSVSAQSAGTAPQASAPGYVTGYTMPGASTVFTVNVPSDGQYAATLRYANPDQSAGTLDIYVNGIRAKTAALPGTGSATAWADRNEQLPLRAGVNTVAYTYDSGNSGHVNLKWLRVSGAVPLASTGATLPYVEEEAEDAQFRGQLLGPSRKFGDVAAEASHRQAVVLRAVGDHVTFTLPAPANAMILRYSIPDSKDGSPYTAPLSLYLNGTKVQDLTLTNKYSWFYGQYPFTNNPSDGQAHHFFDEVHTLFGRTYPAGTTVTVQRDAQDTAASYTLDLADFAQVPAPYQEPDSGYISVTAPQFGADPTGARNSTSAIQAAVTYAENHGLNVWVPAGLYTVTGHIILNHVTIRGAGPWYTTLHGLGVGLYGDYAGGQGYPGNADGSSNPSAHVGIYDLAIQGETTDRVDQAQVNGIGGSLGSGSVIQNVWIEHTKVGMWFDGPFTGLLIVDCRVHDTTADGINFHNGISNAWVEETDIRNTGDDGLAMWSEHNPDYNDSFAFNTVRSPILANNFAIYGGHDNSIVHNYGADTLTQGGGIQVANRFGAVPLSGTTTISGNTLDRTGQQDPNWNFGVGAIWFYASDGPMSGKVDVSNNTLNDSTDEAYQFTSDSDYPITNVTVHDDTINKAGTFAVQIQTSGAATFTNVTAHSLGVAGVDDCYNTSGSDAFLLTASTGDDTWSNSRGCYTLSGLGTNVGTATPVAQPTYTPEPVPPAPQTVWLVNKANGQFLTYDAASSRADFTPTLNPSDTKEQWVISYFGGSDHICSATATGTSACMANQDPNGNQVNYVHVGLIYNSWASARWNISPGPDAGYSYIQNVWQSTLYAGSAQNLGYADMETLGAPAPAEWQIVPISSGPPTIGPTSTPAPPTSTPTATPSVSPTPTVPTTPVWLRNRGNSQYVVYDPTTDVARFTSTVTPGDQYAEWRFIPFNGKLHICSVTNTEPYGPGQDTACWSEQAWTDTAEPTPPGAPAPGPDGHLSYVRVGSTYDTWGSNQFSLIDQGDGYDQIKVTGWYDDLVDSSAGYGYADVTYTPSAPANAAWQVIPAAAVPTSTPTSTSTPTDTPILPTNTPVPTFTPTPKPTGAITYDAVDAYLTGGVHEVQMLAR